MRIKLVQDVPGYHTNEFPMLSAGNILEAVRNPAYTARNGQDVPRWLAKIASPLSPMGIYSHEAEELQECGHPVGSIVAADEGTHYCSECAAR